jgi:hypothetical protein
MNKKTSIIILIAAAIFAVSTGLSLVLFSHILPSTKLIQTIPPTKLANGSLQFDQNLPKIESCPLNGVKYSTQQKQWWQQHGPLGVMVENHTEARPQSGLSYADIIYEAVAEGGITRFMGVFYCQDAPEIGPIRSARTYYIDFLSEYGAYPLYGHVGGANAAGPANALGQLDDYGWSGYNDLNQFSIGFPTFWRDYNRVGRTVATEHTMYSTTTKLWDFAKTNRGLTQVDKNGKPWDTNFVSYSFKEDALANARGTAQSIHLEFWTGLPDYFVNWVYDSANNVYKRFDGSNQPYFDFDNKKQLSTKTLVILHMAQDNASDGYQNNEHLLFQDKGTGSATIFMDGKKVDGIWKKASRTARTLIYDNTGTPITFDRGIIWFTVLPLDGVMSVK